MITYQIQKKIEGNNAWPQCTQLANKRDALCWQLVKNIIAGLDTGVDHLKGLLATRCGHDRPR